VVLLPEEETLKIAVGGASQVVSRYRGRYRSSRDKADAFDAMVLPPAPPLPKTPTC
jgi:hypothetical protein